jgi:hypothetical protein
MKKVRAKPVKKSVTTPKKGIDRRGKNPKSLSNLRPPWKAGDPSPNPAGRPKLLGESYKAWLGGMNDSGITNAEAVAIAMGRQALQGDVQAAREIRSATEGDKIKLLTWQNELAELLKEGKLTPADLIAELGIDDARSILVAAGQAIPESVSEQGNTGAG